ncbi:MAG: hypothetical protein JNL70_12405 [Saprospiraceae bacterium]|nr:hypothetical protein [Saprospiraceae bacterium]
MMDKINGLKISKLGFKPVLLGDFINHEGPIVSHFTDAENPHEHYVYKWVDCDDVCNRWLVAKTSEETISKFLFQQVSLFQIINQNEFVYLVDLDSDLDEKQILITKTSDLPNDYLPEADSYFDENQYEDYALQLKENILGTPNSIVLEHLLNEVLSLKRQQFETNHLLNLLIKQNKAAGSAQVLAEPESNYGTSKPQ